MSVQAGGDEMTMKTTIALALLLTALAGGSSLAELQGPSAAVPTNAPVTESNSTSRLAYRHAYYLFQAGVVNGCEDCYVPLLITQEPLDEIAKHTESADCLWITTYERDSIWQMNGTVAVAPGTIDAPRRLIRFNEHSYRYQEITTREALKLLQKPIGAIPVSRPYMPDKSTPGSSLDDLISDFRTIFRMRERQMDPAPIQKGEEALPRKVLLSEVTVLDDGTVRYRVASGCFGRSDWGWISQCPGSASSGKVLQYKLPSTQLYELRTLLDRQEVKEISDFMNAAPIFDDFEIEIPLQEGSQHVLVFAFMPNHIELQQHPALLHVICKAKRIEAAASNSSETPVWCKNIPPLE
jgi:hypothetical protein